MRKLFFFVAFLPLAVMLGCGASKTATAPQGGDASHSPQTMNWAFAPKALELTFISDPFLNEYEGAAHPLTVCVYQIQSHEAFQQLAVTAPGVSRLLDCAAFGSDAVSAQRVVVQPGRNEVLTIDRKQSAKYVAIVCGYYGSSPSSATRIYEIPVSSNTSGWLWWKQTTYEPGKLSRKILLGKTGMQGDE